MEIIHMKLFKFAVLGLLLTPLFSIANEGGKAKIVTSLENPVACISAVHINNIDGQEVQVQKLGFDIDAGTHTMLGRAMINTSFCKVVGRSTGGEKPVPLEADFEAGNTYYVGFDHSAPNRKDWKLVIWKVKDGES
jgi:hypothetical protein